MIMLLTIAIMMLLLMVMIMHICSWRWWFFGDDDDYDTDERDDDDDDHGDDVLLSVPLHSLESEVKPLAVSICVQIRPVDNNDSYYHFYQQYDNGYHQ